MIQMPKVEKMLTNHEGIRHHPYKCTAGKTTIGVGRNLDDVGLSYDEILYLLRNDINNCITELDRNFPWFAELSEARQMALIDMCFNLGISRLKKFKNMLAAMAVGNFTAAAAEAQDSSWYRQVGVRAVRVCEMIKEG